MKEIEITEPLLLDASQTVSLDTHAFLNVMNVLCFELYHLGECSGMEAELDDTINRIIKISHEISMPDLAFARVDEMLQEAQEVENLLETVRCSKKAAQATQEVDESIANVLSILKILRHRVLEAQSRLGDPTAWKSYDIKELSANYTEMLGAIEKNSKGRFRIFYNIAAQQDKDYYVDFKIESIKGSSLMMPQILEDVFRDLITNARKYTAPGGRISAGIYEYENSLILIVEDSGYGIPKAEIPEVVKFGIRGSNVASKKTFGGGFGLTKAYHYCKRLNGRMWIKSGENAGTRVKIRVPREIN